METENQPDNGTTKGKSRVYFTLGGVFLIAMALFWSVDASLVYIFLGIASFFRFLGFFINGVTIGLQLFNGRFQFLITSAV